MIALNHVLTGTAIGLAVKQPLLVAPLALLSHFVLDAIPHFTYGKPGTLRFWITWSIDAVACIAALGLLCTAKPELAWSILLGGVMAELPDVFWTLQIRKKALQRHWFFTFHSWIQWSETNLGGLVELLYLALILFAHTLLLN